jgi:acetolactate synthase-1/2/3 large subunit
MNGAEAILKTLADCGVSACFTNPGTSEMQMVSAFDREPRVRPVLCLFEGVATGAADGYGRMAEKPAATLLHLGPGLANGGANLHNARRAFTPVVNIVGDHATYHQACDAPLQSDIESLARPHSTWVKSANTADEAAGLAAEAVAASFGPPGGVATLILPADSAWTKTGNDAAPPALPLHRYAIPAPFAQVEAAARSVKAAKKPVLLLGGLACHERALDAAGRIAGVGVRVMTDTFTARLPRGAGRFAPDRMPYFGEMALADLAGVDLILLAGTKTPVAFFAYPAMPSVLAPEGCRIELLSALHEDGAGALEALAEALGAKAPAPTQVFHMSAKPTGELSAYAIGDSIARWAPEGAVIADDAVTAGLPIFMQTRCAKPHEWLMLTGGAIGAGMPMAVGAAVAAPDRKVISLNGDGAGAYTLQSLWTMAREGLDVTTVIFANHAYRILDIEFGRTRSGEAGPAASKLLDLSDPRMDWVSLARGFGVPAVRCETAELFDKAFARAMAATGPHLIEATMA